MTQNYKKLQFLLHSISHKAYIIYDCDFWYTCIKWWHLQMLFSFLQNFDFLVGEEVMGDRRAKNGLKWQNILSLTPYLRNRTSYHCSFRGTYVKWLYLQQFFRFFKILIFGDFRGAGVICHTIYQYLKNYITSSFLLHRCKIMLSPGVFLYFSTL